MLVLDGQRNDGIADSTLELAVQDRALSQPVLPASCQPGDVTFGPAVHAPSDASAALWIAPSLGRFGTVGGLVPHGYERYLLLDYRAEEHPGFDGVSRLFGQLAGLLAEHTSTADDCWFAIWEGYGFTTWATMLAGAPGDDRERQELDRERRRLREDDARRKESIRAALSVLPAFDLPARRYYLVHGGVTAASKIERPDGSSSQPPDLWWPEDRRWFVAGDTDLDWCYIAGSEQLVSTVSAEFGRRTRPVDWEAANAAVGE